MGLQGLFNYFDCEFSVVDNLTDCLKIKKNEKKKKTTAVSKITLQKALILYS